MLPTPCIEVVIYDTSDVNDTANKSLISTSPQNPVATYSVSLADASLCVSIRTRPCDPIATPNAPLLNAHPSSSSPAISVICGELYTSNPPNLV